MMLRMKKRFFLEDKGQNVKFCKGFNLIWIYLLKFYCNFARIKR